MTPAPGVEGPQVHVQVAALAVLHAEEVALHRPTRSRALPTTEPASAPRSCSPQLPTPRVDA